MTMTDQTAALAEARATNQRLNREKQRLESELATYRRAVADWTISDRGTYVPLRSLAAIAKAAGLEVPERWELHYERVERAEAALTAASTVQAPAAGRAALRDRIAAAIWERQNPGRLWADCEYRWRADAEEDADAVLAVLPAPVDRAAVLREAADAIESTQNDRDDIVNDALGFLDNNTEQQHIAVRRSARLLRRMADEAQP
jgi:hypothetical protein